MTLAIVTPSYAPDFLRFCRLHQSVVDHAPAGTRHYVLVPPPDYRQFSAIVSDHLTVLRQPDVLPKNFLSTARLARLPYLPRGYRIAAVNVRAPWPPIRGWVLQQLVKLSFVSRLDADVALMVDSDVLMVRPFSEDRFRKGDSIRHFRVPQAIHPAMKRHLAWRQTAARLLGLGAPSSDLADYNAGVVSWSPAIVRGVLSRVEEVAGRPWQTVIGAQLDVSEYFLYGEYVAALGTNQDQAFTADRSLCHSYWERMTVDKVDDFIDSIPGEDIALLVQSNSDTSEAVLEHIATQVRRRPSSE